MLPDRPRPPRRSASAPAPPVWSSADRIRYSRSTLWALASIVAPGGRRRIRLAAGLRTSSVSLEFPPASGSISNGPGSPVTSEIHAASPASERAAASVMHGRIVAAARVRAQRVAGDGWSRLQAAPAAQRSAVRRVGHSVSAWPGTSAPTPSSSASSRGCASSCARRSTRWRRSTSTTRRSCALPRRSWKPSGSRASGRRTSVPSSAARAIGQVKLGLMHEILGGCEFAPPIFGNQAPDSGNSELIAIAATPEQKARWLTPLLAGEIYSAFSMTEQGTGADPTQFTTTAVLEGDEWVINGTKWFVSNADRSRLPHADGRHRSRRGPPSARVDDHRPVRHAGHRAAAHLLDERPDRRAVAAHPGRGQLHATCASRAENLLGERGGAFALAQKRLGPGRIHHCMRWIGVCRRAFDALCERAVSKSLHGSRLADKQTVQNWVAESAAAIEASRLLTLQAAWKIDREGAEAARTEIAMIKYHGAAVMHDVDRPRDPAPRLVRLLDRPAARAHVPLGAGRAHLRRARRGPQDVGRAGAAARGTSPATCRPSTCRRVAPRRSRSTGTSSTPRR